MLPGPLESFANAVNSYTGTQTEPLAAAKPLRAVKGKVGVIPVRGVMMNRPGYISQLFGAKDIQEIREDFDTLMAMSDVGAIVFQIDSPGGSVFGVDELSEHVFNSRGKGKRIISIADGYMASAAYALGSAAEEVYATSSSAVGSIGVYFAHTEFSKAEEAAGIKTTHIFAGKYKVDGNESEPLSETAKKHMQEAVDRYYDQFVSKVAKHRGDSKANVKNGYGEGRALHALDALEEKLIDRIESVEGLISKLSGSAASKNSGKSRRMRQLNTI